MTLINTHNGEVDCYLCKFELNLFFHCRWTFFLENQYHQFRNANVYVKYDIILDIFCNIFDGEELKVTLFLFCRLMKHSVTKFPRMMVLWQRKTRQLIV